MCNWLADSPARLALVDLGDLVLDPEQENRPGPLSGRTSWRHRLPLLVEDLDGASVVRRRLAPLAGRAAAPDEGMAGR
jgi:4-alpha-glucanotransferase